MSGQGVGVRLRAAWRALLAGIVVVGALGPVMVAGPSADAMAPGVRLPRGSRDGSPVHVLRVSPADGASYADFRDPLTVRFNQSMDRASVAAGFALRDAAGRAVPGTLSWLRPDTLVFRPLTWLARGAAYSAVVGAGLRSAEGS